MIRRLALAIVRRYPAAWRERYEEELSALLEDSPARLSDLAELGRGLIAERARELVSSSDRPKRTAAVLMWMPAVFMVLFTAIAAALGLLLRGVTGPWPEDIQEKVALACAVALLALLIVQIVVDVRHRHRAPRSVVTNTPAWLAILLGPIPFGMVLCTAWGSLPIVVADASGWWLQAFMRGYLYFLVLSHLTSSLWPGRDLLQALGELEAAEGHLKMSETWVQSCREWIAKGVPSPLDEALAQVGKWTIERDAARARLKELGYGARFRPAA